MKRTLTTIIILLSFIPLFSQGIDDARQFSQTYYQGTAKAMSMGNALGAVGGDMTAVCINPAGMGIYRSDEFTTTLNLLDNYQQSSYYKTDNGANKMRLSIPNIGYVSTKQKSNYRNLRFTQFGIGLTRTNDYNIHSFAEGFNPTSSRANNSTFLSQIEGDHPDDLPSDVLPMWETYLIDEHFDNDGYYYTSNVPRGHVTQSMDNRFKGRSEEWSFAMSANYYERLFLGASLNITHIKREGTRVFSESREPDLNTDFMSWNYSEDISSHGAGCNGKIGFIYHANDWFRFGGAFHTPSITSFDESWQTVTTAQFVRTGQHTYTSQESNYEYIFISPLKWVGSMSFVIGRHGMFSFDAEYTNYGAARFSHSADDDYDYSSVNTGIKSTYGKSLNFRCGTEWLVGNSYIRLGASYYGSPLGFGQTDGSVKKGSCGFSIPIASDASFDFAYELTYGQSNVYLYDYDGLQPVNQRQFKSNLAATLKAKF